MRTSRIVLSRPGLLPLALGSFLLRGGALLLILPIVVLPSTGDVAVFLGANAVTPAGPSESLLVALGAALALVVAWLAAGRLAAAAFELAAFELSAARSTSAAWPLVLRAWAVRIACLAPIAVVLALGAGAIGSAAYTELILPGDLRLPLLVRIVIRVPAVCAALAGAWLVGELIGGIAVRRVALLGEGPFHAIVGALLTLVRRPVLVAASFGATFATWVAANGIAVALLVALRRLLGAGSLAADRRIAAALIVLLAATWLVALGFVGAGAAFRAVRWTLAVEGALEGGSSSEPPPEAEPIG